MLSGGSYNVAEAEQSQHTVYVDTIVCTVCLLDSSCVSFKLDKYCRGQILLDLTFDYLELLERDFFGLVFNGRQSGEAAIIKWLDPTKKIRKQCSDQPPYTFWFRVKFYVSDPICLQQEYTRYQFFLQVRKDILEGRLPVTKSTSAHLAGLVLQAELGDFNPEDCRPGYVSQFRFIQQQTAEFESQASDWHRKFSCMLPDAAELEFLNVARQLERYGVKTQEAFDVQDNSSSVLIGVSFAGITVFRAGKAGFQFPWNNVVSIRYKGKKFTVQLKSPNMAILPMNGSVSALMRAPSNVTLTGPSPYPNSDTNLLHIYRFTSTAQSKAFWQYAVACHAFFRVREPTVQSDSVFSRLSNRVGSVGTTSISATAVYAAISRVTSGFRRYFSIVRRNSPSAAGLGGPVGGIERTLSTVMELRRNSRASDRGFSRSNSRRSLRRSAVNSFAAASLTQSTGLRTTSNLSLTADRPVGPGGDQIPSNPMPIKSYAQMPPGARVPVINTGSLRLPPATSSANRPVPITQVGSAALTDDLPHSNQARQSSLNPGSSSRVKKIPSQNEPATGSNLQISSSRSSYLGSTSQMVSDKSSRPKLSKPSSPSMGSGVRSSQRRPPQTPQTTSASPALSGRGSEQISPKPGVRSNEPRVKERRILADHSTRASADLSVSDHSEDAENADFDRDEAARYWHVRRTQAVSRPTRLPSKGRVMPSAMHESFHNRNEPDVRMDTSSNRSSRHANEYDLTNLTASTEAMANKSDPLRPKANSRSNPGRQLSAVSKKTSDGTTIPRKESTSQPDLHERTHPSAVTHSKGSGHQTSSNFVRDPFHPGAPAGESCSTVEPEVNDGLVWIRIRPDSHGHFGFNIRGGADFGAPIIVSRVAPNMPADLCIPRLSEGDQLIAINGRNVAGHTHAEVNSFIRGAREDQTGLLELLVKPGDYVTDDFNEDSEVPDSGDAPPLPPRTPQPFSRQSSVPLSGSLHRHNVLSSKHGSLVSYAQSLDGTEDPLLLSVLELECGLADGSILARFEQLPRRKPGYTMNASRLNENILKNRYRDISPYDQTRVILQQGPGDYINASFVIMDFPKAGFTVNYIAAQGPLPCTYGSFWQMCWEQHVSVVVMLTAVSERGRVKCHQYWPDLGQVFNFSISNLQAVSNKQSKSTTRNDVILRVQTLREETTGDFAFRDFTLSHVPADASSTRSTGEVRRITQLQYISWPDHGIPSSPTDLIAFVRRVREKRGNSSAPVVVHCSAGIGRTGVLITVETAMNLMERRQPVRPLELVQHMRAQRALLIQTTSQFQFVCETILKVFQRDYIDQTFN